MKNGNTWGTVLETWGTTWERLGDLGERLGNGLRGPRGTTWSALEISRNDLGTVLETSGNSLRMTWKSYAVIYF
ncbi:unnamed protein product [Rhizophagus irregularis]|nr:unnamed protein product [Rhizophagus irregularis]